jgi:glucose/arabinose dehydrogenase
MSNTVHTPPKRDRFRDKKYAKLLLAVAALEVLGVICLLIWTTSKTALAPTAKPTAQTEQKTTTPMQPTISLAPVASGLTAPVDIAATHNITDKRLFVVEQAGVIRSIDGDKKLDPTPFLDIQNRVLSGGEMGLLGLAFHPKSVENNFFYVNYIDKQQNTIVARYTIDKTSGRGDPASEKILLKIKQPYANHNGGDMAFGPDGYLYIGMGDGGGAGDPDDRAQNKTDLLGKILRIDVDKGKLYAVPSSNPYAEQGGKPEIWASGLRNPWRFSFDHLTGELFIADVGQGNYEEINLQPSTSKGGENYGWRCIEGTHTFSTTGCQNAASYTQPIIEYDHSEKRCSVTGGYVYRGHAYTSLLGSYFYGDYCGGQLYYAKRQADGWKSTLGSNTDLSISTFGQDSNGELYLADLKSGTIYQIQAK